MARSAAAWLLRNYDTDDGDDTDTSHPEDERRVSPPHAHGNDSPRHKSGSSHGSEAEREESDELHPMELDRGHMVRQSLDRADDLEHSIADIVPEELRLTLEKKAIRLKMEIIDWMNVRPQPARRLDRRCLSLYIE
jgi:hypothetical protein